MKGAKTTMFIVSEAWKTTYPGAAVGVLAMGQVDNPERCTALDEIKEELESQIRARYTSKEEVRSLERLQAYRSLLGLGDNVYVAVYSAPLLLGVDLLPGQARRLGVLLALGTAAADVVENVALEDALGVLLADPSQPELADPSARRARRAASVKFALLGPAIGMAIVGVARAWR